MKTLLLLRHAKSSWSDPAMADHDRPLNNRGRRDAPRMGRLIENERLIPDTVISSSAKRARETAATVAEDCCFEGEIQIADELYHAPPSAYFTHLSQLPNRSCRVLVVGHNPGIEELIELLTGDVESMPTAALAHIRIEIDEWQQCDSGCSAQLIRLWRPKEFDD